MHWKRLKIKCYCNNMKTIADIKEELATIQTQLTTVQQSLAVTQDDLQALQDAQPAPAPEIPKVTVPLNTPVELVGQ